MVAKAVFMIMGLSKCGVWGGTILLLDGVELKVVSPLGIRVLVAELFNTG